MFDIVTIYFVSHNLCNVDDKDIEDECIVEAWKQISKKSKWGRNMVWEWIVGRKTYNVEVKEVKQMITNRKNDPIADEVNNVETNSFYWEKIRRQIIFFIKPRWCMIY